MSVPRLLSTVPSASDWLLLNQMRMPREANEVAGEVDVNLDRNSCDARFGDGALHYQP